MLGGNEGRADETFFWLEIFGSFDNKMTFNCQIFDLDYKKAISNFSHRQIIQDPTSNLLLFKEFYRC